MLSLKRLRRENSPFSVLTENPHSEFYRLRSQKRGFASLDFIEKGTFPCIRALLRSAVGCGVNKVGHRI